MASVDRPFTRIMCCLLSVTAFAMVLSFANFTRASRGRSSEREAERNRMNFTHFQRDVKLVKNRGYRNDVAVSLSSDDRQRSYRLARSRFGEQHVICLINNYYHINC